MTGRRRFLAAVLAAAQAAAWLSAAPARAARWRPSCRTLVVSPGYARDRTAFCVFRASGVDPYELAVTTDAGRSWRVPPATGMVRNATNISLGISLSPRYPADRMVFAIIGTGTYVSTDRGESFRLLDGLAKGGSQDNPVPFLSAPIPELAPLTGTQPQVYLAYAGRVAARIDVANGVHEPALGAPDLLVGFAAVAPTLPPVAFSYRPMGTGMVAAATRCTPQLACAGVPFTFPAGLEYADYPDLWARGLGDGKTLVVRLVRIADGSTHLWRSTDGGATFAEWRSVEALLKPANDTSDHAPGVFVAAHPDRPSTLYLRISGTWRRNHSWDKAAPPAERVLRSVDGGQTWRLVAFQRGEWQAGPRGALPWHSPANGPDGNGLFVARGALFAVGGGGGPGTVFCSRDGGVRWATAC